MMREMEKSHKIIGIKETLVGNFQTMHFNTIPQIELVRFIEDAIKIFQPDAIVTHHPTDVHSDHQQVSIACNTAARISQRQTVSVNRIKALYYMEVPSSTDWGSASGTNGFRPNTYVGVSGEDFNAKIEALKVYTEGSVLRNPPHPRSEKALEALAVKRGSEIGCLMAESFECVFKEGI
jgi:LmbE family N-acetylglucosaminyl deacetylase